MGVSIYLLVLLLCNRPVIATKHASESSKRNDPTLVNLENSNLPIDTEKASARPIDTDVARPMDTDGARPIDTVGRDERKHTQETPIKRQPEDKNLTDWGSTIKTPTEVRRRMRMSRRGQRLRHRRDISEECYHGDGSSYMGTVSQTRSGYTCQRWDSQSPQKHPDHAHKPYFFPDARMPENYCRKVKNDVSPIFCYTTSPRKYAEACDIPKCTTLDYGWTIVGGVEYKRFKLPIRISFAATKKFCESHNARLPEPRDKESNDRLASVQRFRHFFLGITYIQGQWKYVSDPSKTVDWFNWQPNKPGGHGDCAGMMAVGFDKPKLGQWSDLACDYRHNQVACERKPVDNIDGWTITGAVDYKLFEQRASFADAQKLCETHDATLPEPRDKESNDKLAAQLKGTQVFLGITDKGDEARWKYVSDPSKAVVWSKWRQHEPDGANKENCAAVNPTYGQWTDVNCGDTLQVACERKQVRLNLNGFLPLPSYEESEYIYKLVKEYVQYKDAQTACKKLDATLAEASTGTINSGIREILLENKINGEVWLGATDIAEENKWTWQSSGKVLNYTNWREGEPDNGTNIGVGIAENCLATTRGAWSDEYCDRPLKYICMKVPVSGVGESCQNSWYCLGTLKCVFGACLCRPGEVRKVHECYQRHPILKVQGKVIYGGTRHQLVLKDLPTRVSSYCSAWGGLVFNCPGHFNSKHYSGTWLTRLHIPMFTVASYQGKTCKCTSSYYRTETRLTFKVVAGDARDVAKNFEMTFNKTCSVDTACDSQQRCINGRCRCPPDSYYLPIVPIYEPNPNPNPNPRSELVSDAGSTCQKKRGLNEQCHLHHRCIDSLVCVNPNPNSHFIYEFGSTCQNRKPEGSKCVTFGSYCARPEVEQRGYPCLFKYGADRECQDGLECRKGICEGSRQPHVNIDGKDFYAGTAHQLIVEVDNIPKPAKCSIWGGVQFTCLEKKSRSKSGSVELTLERVTEALYYGESCKCKSVEFGTVTAVTFKVIVPEIRFYATPPEIDWRAGGPLNLTCSRLNADPATKLQSLQMFDSSTGESLGRAFPKWFQTGDTTATVVGDVDDDGPDGILTVTWAYGVSHVGKYECMVTVAKPGLAKPDVTKMVLDVKLLEGDELLDEKSGAEQPRHTSLVELLIGAILTGAVGRVASGHGQ